MAGLELPPYRPPHYLVANSFLTAEQLVFQFEGFKESLIYLPRAPEMVFERLIGNVLKLNESIKAYLDRERREDEAALEACEAKHKVLGSSIDKLQQHLGASQVSSTATRDAMPHRSAGDVLPDTPGGGGLVEAAKARGLRPVNESAVVARPAVPVRFSFGGDRWATTLSAYTICSCPDIPNLYRTGCTWSDITCIDRDHTVQPGCYTTLQDHPPGSLCSQNTHIVTFSYPFLLPPIVIVWLTGFDMDPEKPWHVKTFTTQVTRTGFILHIDSSQDSVMYSAGVAWVAYRSSDPRIESDRLDTSVPGSWENSMRLIESEQLHAQKTFNNRVPRYVMVIDSIEAAGGDLTLSLSFQDRRQGKFLWCLRAGPDDAHSLSVGATFLRFV